jgi:Cu/Ag efflux protein CusF
MKNHLSLAVIALAVVLGAGTIIAAPGSATAEENAAEAVDGVVTGVNVESHRITVRNSDGTTYEFEASDETLKGFKVGDRIEAKRRPTTK